MAILVVENRNGDALSGTKLWLFNSWDTKYPCYMLMGGFAIINPNRSLGPISSGDVKVFSCSPESKECLPLIYGSHKT